MENKTGSAPTADLDILELHKICVKFGMEKNWDRNQFMDFLVATIAGQFSMSNLSDEKIDSHCKEIANIAKNHRLRRIHKERV